jgi:tRNA nucleotidyltransferase/poly(A) polymerase
MDLKQIAKDTTKTLISYVTYQALRVVIAQLDETEPKRAYWLRQFSHRVSIQDSEAYLEALFREEQRLAFRLLTVREHIVEEMADYLPEMLRTGVQQANMQQRTQQLERMTQVDPQVEEAADPTRDSPAIADPQPQPEPDSTEERLPPESLW